MNRAIFRESALIRTFRRGLLAAGVVALLASLAGCAHVPFAIHDSGVKGPATIAGQVSSERGAIIADAEVLLASSRDSSSGPTVRRQTKTDVRGRFAFEQVPLGSYVVTASPTGYKATKQKVTVEKEGTVRADLKVRM
jgi:Carboxypeptidase regulatory-like domain